MYLLLKKWAFNIQNSGQYIFEYSREHRQQRWYLTVLHYETKIMMANTVMDENIDKSTVCLFDVFLKEAVPAIDRYLEEIRNGKIEAIHSEEETENGEEQAEPGEE